MEDISEWSPRTTFATLSDALADQNLSDEAAFLTFNTVQGPPALEISRTQDLITKISINGPEGMLVSIDTNSGNLEFREGYEPDKAAKIFWDALGSMYSNAVVERDMYAAAWSCLHEVRRTLQVQEGASVNLTARDLMNDLALLRDDNRHLVDLIRKHAHTMFPAQELTKNSSPKFNFDDAMRSFKDFA